MFDQIIFKILPEYGSRYVVFGNTLKQIIYAILSLPVFLLVFKILQVAIIRRLEGIAKKTKTDIDDVFIKVVNSLRPPFYFFLSFYLSIKFLTFSPTIVKVLNAVLTIWVVYQIIIALHILTDYILRKLTKRQKDSGGSSIIDIIGRIVKYSLWLFGILIVLSNLGVNISALITGLGIGGIAIALALQNILGDLFSSFAIYFDKPFTVGDFIIVGDKKGTVERIGIKTTRLKSLKGEEIVIPNKKLTSERIHNYKKMKERRVFFNFGVVYQTKTSSLREIPKIVKEIIKDVKDARCDRVHFYKFGDFALEFEVVYFVNTNKYKRYMDINEKILLKIKERFEKEGIEMAYPTQTVYLGKQGIVQS